MNAPGYDERGFAAKNAADAREHRLAVNDERHADDIRHDFRLAIVRGNDNDERPRAFLDWLYTDTAREGVVERCLCALAMSEEPHSRDAALIAALGAQWIAEQARIATDRQEQLAQEYEPS